MKDKIETQKDRMDRIIEWVKACDTKTSIVMTIALLVPTFIMGNDWVLERLVKILTPVVEAIKNHGEGYRFSWQNFVVLFLFVLTLVFFSICIIKFIRVLLAKTRENTYGNGVKNNSLIHFYYISTIKDFGTYKQLAECEKEDDYYEDLLSQTYINAKRCKEKFDDYNSGVRWLSGAIISLVLFIVTLFIVTA